MAARGRGTRRGATPRRHENDERWLLTYADMITLLMALFMVLFSISSVNISKYQTLQQSLKSAFSGSVLSGGHAILQSGSQSTSAHTPATCRCRRSRPSPPTSPSRATRRPSRSPRRCSAPGASAEQTDFEHLKHELDAYAQATGSPTRCRR